MKLFVFITFIGFPSLSLAQEESILVIHKVVGAFIKVDTLRGAKADSARAAMKKNSQKENLQSPINYSYKPVSQPVFKTEKDSVDYYSLMSQMAKPYLTPDSRDSLWQLGNQLVKNRTLRFEDRYLSDRDFTSLENIPNEDLPKAKNISVHNVNGKLPARLWLCESIEKLEILNCNVKKLPHQLSRFKKLKSIYVVNNLSKRPLRLSRNKTVTKLLFRGKGYSIPNRFAKIKSPEWLDLSGSGLTQFPVKALNCKKLKLLYLKGNEITLSEEKFKTNKILESIDFSGNKITHVSKEFSRLPNLISLNFNTNKIESVDSSLASLSKLSELSFYANKLKQIPDGVYKMQNLTELDLYFNQIERLDSRISNWKSMKILYLAHNRLLSIPETIGLLTNLNQLYLHNNRLSDLPVSVGEMRNLKILRINNNYFAGLPANIDHLVNLENFDLSSNQLRTLPENF